ncbi:MAG: hypothetical protein QW400_02965 [Candidatus Diapherotrites archaeon]
MLKKKCKLLLFVIVAFCGIASARTFITDANVTITDTNRVALYVECYDENGNRVGSGTNVRYSTYEEKNCYDINYIISQSTISCNTSADIGEYPPGIHCLVLESLDGHVHTTFFNINKPRFDYNSIDEGGLLTAIIAIILTLAVANSKNKCEKKPV